MNSEEFEKIKQQFHQLTKDGQQNKKKEDNKPKATREELLKKLRNKTNMKKMQRKSKLYKKKMIKDASDKVGGINPKLLNGLKLNKDTMDKLKKYMPETN